MFGVTVSDPEFWSTVQATRVVGGEGTQERPPKLWSVPAPTLLTLTLAEAGVVFAAPSMAENATLLTLSDSTGWSIRNETSSASEFVAPGAETATVAAPGLNPRPEGFAVRTTTFPPDTLHCSHAAGASGQVTGPSRPEPLFDTVMR
jgi:hypothetical protein